MPKFSQQSEIPRVSADNSLCTIFTIFPYHEPYGHLATEIVSQNARWRNYTSIWKDCESTHDLTGRFTTDRNLSLE